MRIYYLKRHILILLNIFIALNGTHFDIFISSTWRINLDDSRVESFCA